MTETRKSTKSTKIFSDEERDAMKERAREEKAARSGKADGESDLLAKIAEMSPAEQAIARRLHEIVKTTAPELEPRTWYGSPAYARAGKVICFFQPASKFKTRYSTLGLNEDAHLDDGSMWPTSFALTELTAADETRIVALIKKAVG